MLKDYFRYETYRPCGPIVPGVGPVLSVDIKFGRVVAAREDENGNKIKYIATDNGWERLIQ